MRFQVSGQADCRNCPVYGRDSYAGPFVEEIEARDEHSAREVFMSKKRLCKRCLPKHKANLQFNRETLLVTTLGS
jgi:hypothetical protein